MKKTIITIIAIILIIVLLWLLFWFIRENTDNFQSEFKLFYIELDDRRVSDSESGYCFDSTHDVAVKYAFGIFNNPGYSYEIIPSNNAYSATFKVDGVKHSLADIDDYTDCFDIEASDDGFRLYCKNVYLEDVIAKAFDGEISSLHADAKECYFILVVHSGSGDKTIGIGFSVRIKNIPVDRITLNPTEIVF